MPSRPPSFRASARADPARSRFLNAWFDSGGEEIGDLCAYNYGMLDEDHGIANQKWNRHFYLVQMEWDNAQAACVQEGP